MIATVSKEHESQAGCSCR